MSDIESTLSRIVSQLPGYELRPQQLAMARAVEVAIERREHLVVEAGTGSGKSFAYLIPILESGKKAVISTGTIALQEQLLRKDIPFLQEATGRELKVALAKGRGNYICLRKLFEEDQSMGALDPQREEVIRILSLVKEAVWKGDRAELPFVPDPGFWSGHLASDSEDCLGPRCANFAFTPHRVARLACEEADLIVANHALYFTDLVARAGVLPQHEVVVLDEAHQVERAAIGALTITIGRWALLKLLQRLQRRCPGLPPRLRDAVTAAEAEVNEQIFRRGPGQFRIADDPGFAPLAAEMAQALAHLAECVANLDPREMSTLPSDGDQASQRALVQRDQMAAVAEGLASRWDHFATLEDGHRGNDRANWVRVEPQRDYYELNSAPLSVADGLREVLWKSRTCILTSATLAVDGSFAYLKQSLGLDESVDLLLGSPFDFGVQTLLYVPEDLPPPGDPEFRDAIVPEVERILRVSEGRAFVLCTSYRAVRHLAAEMSERLPYPCRTQEEMPRRLLLEWFRDTPNSVLFATATFWEGVDVPGESLSCVVIDKLPFACPDDPVVQARTERMRAENEDWFNGFILPRAILSLKQGFGRLIRTREDRGLVAILDRRLLSMRYGQVILRSLPPARRIDALPASLDEAFSCAGSARDPEGTPPACPAPEALGAQRGQ